MSASTRLVAGLVLVAMSLSLTAGIVARHTIDGCPVTAERCELVGGES